MFLEEFFYCRRSLNKYNKQIGNALYFNKITGVWTDQCEEAMLYFCEKFSELSHDDLMANRKEIHPAVPFLSKTIFELKDELLLHTVLQKFSDFLIKYADEDGAGTDMRLILNFTSANNILSSSYSLKLVAAIHKVASARLSSQPDPRKQFDVFELTQIPIVFSAVGVLINEPWSSRTPKWNGLSPVMGNMKRILFRISEELLRPAILNQLKPSKIVYVAQSLQICKYTLPAVPKAMLLRMSDPELKLYEQIPPRELAEFILRITKFGVVHHVVISRAFEVFSAHFKQQHIINRLSEFSCCSIINALKQYKIKDMDLIAMLIARIIEAGLTVSGLHICFTALGILQIKNQMGDTICKEAIRLNLVPNSTKWDYGMLLKRLTHYYKGIRMPPREAAALILQIQLRIDEKDPDITKCISALSSINRARKQGNIITNEIRTKAIMLSRTVFDHLVSAEKSSDVTQISDTLLASYIWALSGLELGEDSIRHLEYSLAFLLKHLEVLQSIHPKVVPSVLAGIKAYKGNQALRGLFIDEILKHLETPHVMRQVDGDSFSSIVQGLSACEVLNEQSESLTTILNRIIFDTKLMMSAPVHTCVGLVRALAILHRKNVIPVENATAIVFQSLLPKLRYLKDQPQLILDLINCTSTLRTRDPAVLSVVMYVTSILPLDDLSSRELGFMIQDLLLLKAIKVPWVNRVQLILLKHIEHSGELPVHVAKWIIFASVKIEANTEHIPIFLKSCIKNDQLVGKIHGGDLTVILWSICRVRIFPADFLNVCSKALLATEGSTNTPFDFVKPNNLITILTGIAACEVTSREINELLTLLVNRSVASGSIHMMNYSAINSLVTSLVNRRIAHSEFFKLAREVIANKMRNPESDATVPIKKASAA